MKPDLGYWLHPDHHEQGIMSRAVTMAIVHHFEGPSSELVSSHILGNASSRAVLLKAGFEDTHTDCAMIVTTRIMVRLVSGTSLATAFCKEF